ncbi:unnamed protein product [Schistosoma curassoni]|uniref:Uncharacterized protein n=1 Tax=Schistosoma curassoni TaxID=6186 RepID=A0A183JYJ1_9TREM|nr:unnamed protein product [Schistosoma curassoni]
MQFDDLRNMEAVCSLPQKAVADGIRPMDVENATLALPILALTSASDPPCSSIMLPRCRGLYNPVDHQKKSNSLV